MSVKEEELNVKLRFKLTLFADKNSILQLRNARGLNRMIYVSCAPKLVSKNWLDLTRPCSKTMRGEPFILKKATAVDLFPHTPHMELVLLFERDVEEEVVKEEKEKVEIKEEKVEIKEEKEEMEVTAEKVENAATNSQ